MSDVEDLIQLLKIGAKGYGHHLTLLSTAASALRTQAQEIERLRSEMRRYLPVIERAESQPEIWEQLTEGTGIATANSYRAALKGDGW